MKLTGVILGVLGLLVGLAAGFYYGKSIVVGPVLPEREQTYVTFKVKDRWYISRATNKDPIRPCEPPIDILAACTPMPDPCKINPKNCWMESWTEFNPETDPFGVPPFAPPIDVPPID